MSVLLGVIGSIRILRLAAKARSSASVHGVSSITRGVDGALDSAIGVNGAGPAGVSR